MSDADKPLPVTWRRHSPGGGQAVPAALFHSVNKLRARCHSAAFGRPFGGAGLSDLSQGLSLRTLLCPTAPPPLSFPFLTRAGLEKGEGLRREFLSRVTEPRKASKGKVGRSSKKPLRFLNSDVSYVVKTSLDRASSFVGRSVCVGPL